MLHVAGFQLIPYALQEKKIFSSKEKFGVDRQCTKYIQVIVCAQIRVSNTELKLLNKFLNFFYFSVELHVQLIDINSFFLPQTKIIYTQYIYTRFYKITRHIKHANLYDKSSDWSHFVINKQKL